MRLIVVGCEYVGKTTLVKQLCDWGRHQNVYFHLDDHFTIPDTQHLSEEEQERMVQLGPVVKERFQRFQVYYHIDVLHNYDHVAIAGGHIEEAVYGPRYYYLRPLPANYHRKIELELPKDTILVLLTARPEVITRRMKAAPRKYGLVKENEIEEVSNAFAEEFGQSWLRRKVRIDTSDMDTETVMKECLKVVRPHLSEKDLVLLRWPQV